MTVESVSTGPVEPEAPGQVAGAVSMLGDISGPQMLVERAQARHFQILNEVAQLISSELDTARVAQTVTDLAVEVSGAEIGAFYHASDERGSPQGPPMLSPRDGIAELQTAPEWSDLAASLRDGPAVRRDDIRSEATLQCLIAGESVTIASCLAVPVHRRDRTHGVLLLGHRMPGVFLPETEDIVSGIAAHAAIAIDNAQLYGAERQLAQIVEASSDAIASKDTRGIVRSWNGGAERLFGYTAEEMIGRSIATLVPADRQSEERDILERIKRGERVETYETVRVRKDGTVVDISLSVSPLRDPTGRVVGACKIARDITERKQALARQELLARETHHRTKNLFAVVHSVVARSFAGKRTIEDAEAAVRHRLHALAQMHIMLLDKNWRGAELAEVVAAEMSPYEGRVAISGPPLMLRAQSVQSFALALHELATNAAKHGALSTPTGQVMITWTLSPPPPDRPRSFTFHWEERGGPAVTVPSERGFGSVVLEQVMAEYADAPPQLDFEPAGIKYVLSGPVDAIGGGAV